MPRRVSVLGSALLLAACASDAEQGEVPRSGTGEGVGVEGLPARGPEGVAASAGSGKAARSYRGGDRPVILFLGTSLSAGFGLSHPDSAFPARIAAKVDSADLGYRVVEAGVPGETSAGGLRRISWVLDDVELAVLVLELGANDGLRGHDPDALRANLEAIVDSTRARHPDASVVVAGMEAPPNLGPDYTHAFRAVFRQVARRHDAALIPFLLEGVAGRAAMNQDDGIHPNARGHRVVAENVWRVLEPLLARWGVGG